MTNKMIHELVMDAAVSALKAYPDLAGCGVVGQNERDLATLIQTEMDKLDGIALVVTVNGVRKIHANPVKWSVDFSVAATEYVPLRETREFFITAIDAAMAAGEAVENAGVGHFDSLTHTTPGEGILEAVANCSGEFEITR